MNFTEWLKTGMNNGWCGPAVCYTHDGLPLSEEEIDDFEMGDPCVHIVRLYEDHKHREAVEQAHSPSIWRK